MPLNFIEHNGKKYPAHEAIGGASLWIRPLAQHYCKGTNGLDIGYSKEKWMLPGAIGIEPTIDHKYHAMQLPEGDYDFIHSSHVLEHVKENWCNVLDYWLTKIKIGGILFLYLPHKSQSYWNVEYNRKHIHEFGRGKIGRYLRSLGHEVWVSNVDYNHSFVVVVEKIGDKDVDGQKLTAFQYKTFIERLEIIKLKYPMLNFDAGITGPDAANFMRDRYDLLDKLTK